MPTALPAKTILNGADNPTTSQMKTALGQLHDRLSESIPDGRLIAEAGTVAAPSVTTTGDTNTGLYFPAADTVAIATGGTERARLDSSGNLLVNRTTRLNNGKVEALASVSEQGFVAQMQSNANSAFQTFNASASATFYVTGFGQIYSTSTSIVAISDQTLKTNIRDLETGLAQVLALRPRRFDWVEGEGTGGKDITGFVAQEVETVLPDLVSDYEYAKNTKKKSLKMGDMVPTLVKAIQEQQALIEAQKTAIESLTARITALEAK